MARVFTEGFEMGDIIFWNSVGTAAIGSTYKRTGAYACVLGNTVATKNITAVSEFYIRFGFYTGSSVNHGSIFQWFNSTTELGSIRMSTGAMTIYTSTGTLVSTVTGITIQLSTWYLFEVHVKIADAGNIDLKIDGVAYTGSSYAGDTKPGAQTTVDILNFRALAGQNASVDDLAMNDLTGTSDTSWCGDGRIIALFPNANGDVSQLVGSDGNSTDNYLLVDEKPHDADTTYVEGTVTNERDMYNLGASSLSNVIVNRVWVESRSRDTVASGGTVALGVLPAGGTEVYSSGIYLLTSYIACKGPEYVTNPADSAAWEVSDLDSLQVGPKTGA